MNTEKYLKEFKKDLNDVVQKEIEKSGIEIKKSIDTALTGRVLNKRSGNLYNSIKIKESTITGIDEKIYRYSISSDVDYGLYWILGIKRKTGTDKRDWLGWSFDHYGKEKKIEDNVSKSILQSIRLNNNIVIKEKIS